VAACPPLLSRSTRKILSQLVMGNGFQPRGSAISTRTTHRPKPLSRAVRTVKFRLHWCCIVHFHAWNVFSITADNKQLPPVCGNCFLPAANETVSYFNACSVLSVVSFFSYGTVLFVLYYIYIYFANQAVH